MVLLTDEDSGITNGTVEILHDTIKAAHENNYKVDLVTPRIDPLVNLLNGYVTEVEFIHSAVGKKAVGKNFVKAYRIFKRLKPDLVHFHCPNYRWGLDVVCGAGLAGVPAIIRTEQNPMMAMPEFPVRILLWFSDRTVSKFIYNCIGNRRRFENFLPYRQDRGSVIVNCINPEDLADLEEDSTTYQSLREEFGFPRDCRIALFAAGYFGLYHEDFRRPLYPILDAFKRLLDDQERVNLAKQWRLLVLGEGDQRASSIVRKMNLGNYVHFAGLRSDFHRILKYSDLVVSASHFEGSALTTFKAWALGVPILSTKVDGLSDVIGEENFEKMMVDHGNIDAYSNAWYEFMIDDPVRNSVHKEAGKIVLKNYTTSQLKARYLRLYQKFLG